MSSYKEKYFRYKLKYLSLKNQMIGGNPENDNTKLTALGFTPDEISEINRICSKSTTSYCVTFFINNYENVNNLAKIYGNIQGYLKELRPNIARLINFVKLLAPTQIRPNGILNADDAYRFSDVKYDPGDIESFKFMGVPIHSMERVLNYTDAQKSKLGSLLYTANTNLRKVLRDGSAIISEGDIMKILNQI